MAKRPLFISNSEGSPLVKLVEVEFEWHPGFSVSQKQKSIDSLHNKATEALGTGEILEVSSKSTKDIGVRLSAFNLKTVTPNGVETTLEALFQGSKVFESGGPFTDLYFGGSLDAKRDPRLKSSGRLTKFLLGSLEFPLMPQTAFYDWLYLRALQPHGKWLLENCPYRVFTDIEFNPKKSINCQAHSLALFFSLQERNLLKDVLGDSDEFISVLSNDKLLEDLL